MPLVRVGLRIALVAAVLLAVGLGGCKNAAQVFTDNNDGGWFSKKMDLFAKPEWAVVSDDKGTLGPSGPVGANELVGADGGCFVAEQPAPPAAPPAPRPDRPVGSMAGDLAGTAATPAAANANDSLSADPGAPQVVGGIALGMTECDTVRRAGRPGNIVISTGERGERKVVLTYLTGVWPGIYRFSDGRLREIDRAPAPPEPVKPVKKQKAKKPAKPKTATNHVDPGFQRTYVQ